MILFAASLLTAAQLHAQQVIEISSVQFAGQLAGVVMVGDDPAKGVEVSEMSPDRRTVIKSFVTDSEGKFDLGKTEKGIHILRLKAPEYNMYWYKVRIDHKSKATLSLMISVTS
jgi:hypothetical protein